MSPDRTCTFCVSNKRHTQNSDSGYHGTKIWEGGGQIVVIQHHSPTMAVLLGQASFQIACLWGKKKEAPFNSWKITENLDIGTWQTKKKRKKEKLFKRTKILTSSLV